ncbi:MAG: GatB/YqeY domain-containing protein [Patescibacteria group bacterium]
MTLYETVGTHLKEAMKSGDTLRRDTLRLLQSAIKNVAIEKRKAPAEFSDSEVEDVIRRMVKQHKDSIEQYRAGNRADLAEKEEAESTLLSAYLPQAMPEEALRALIESALKGSGMTAKAQMGQAMGVAMKRVAGRASGDDVRRIVETLLV